jgi:hypothetical protein
MVCSIIQNLIRCIIPLVFGGPNHLNMSFSKIFIGVGQKTIFPFVPTSLLIVLSTEPICG